MFMMSVRLTKTRVLLGGAALALAVLLGVTGVRMASGANTPVATAPVSESGGAKSKIKNAGAKTNEDRLSFIQSYGWEVEGEPAEVMEVIIPKEFDEVYNEYNSIQKKQGCDLEGYAGKRCKRYSYTVTNYPDTQETVRINLLVYNNKIVGGDVCSLEVEGFMHGFALE